MGRRQLIVFGSVILFICSCSKNIINSVFKGFQKPDNFPEVVYKFQNNPVTEDGFELGRKLFYEPRFSRDNTISCGSCHIQSAGFTHHGHDVSHGIDDRLGKRNSPPIMNLAWSTTFFWDGGVFDLDLQPIVPITTHEEMDETIQNVIVKLQAHPQYPGLFKKAFGSETITTANVMKALSQFMTLCISNNSKYDSVMRKAANVSFTAEEQAGYTLVKQKCTSCHQEPLFTDYSFRNNGIAIGANNDSGRYAVTLNPTDMYKFKVPSLRNLYYTAPFMHDGRFYNLDAVLDHYSNHVQKTPNLDPALQQNGTLGIPLTADEKNKIKAFLNTLNDRNFVTDKRFAE